MGSLNRSILLAGILAATAFPGGIAAPVQTNKRPAPPIDFTGFGDSRGKGRNKTPSRKGKVAAAKRAARKAKRRK